MCEKSLPKIKRVEVETPFQPKLTRSTSIPIDNDEKIWRSRAGSVNGDESFQDPPPWVRWPIVENVCNNLSVHQTSCLSPGI